MSEDILKKIVDRRRADIERLGLTFGFDIPEKRTVGRCEFLGRPGPILEVKRASPSKGDIAPDLVPADLACTYAAAGAQAISVLTETNYFKGTLADLITVAKAVDNGDGTKKCAVLRKDFLLFEDEIDIAYRCGADAVLLIARILDDEQLIKMAKRAQSFEMQAFVEVREPDDLRKLNLVLETLDKEAAGDAAKSAERTIVAGVNSRDLATFHIDPMVPAAIRNKLPAKAVFESGVHTPADAAFARSLGFKGILVGEAVAKNPPLAAKLVAAFGAAEDNRRGDFWKTFAERRDAKRAAYGAQIPMVKICGITREEDGFAAAEMGADMLGFVFSNTKRLTNEKFVRDFTQLLRSEYEAEGKLCPLFIGVITETTTEEGKTAIKLAAEGVLDAVQFHGFAAPAFDSTCNCAEALDNLACHCEERSDAAIQAVPATLPCYNALRIGSAEDFENFAAIRKHGEPRVLLDAKVEGIPGGSGQRIPEELLREKAGETPFWLAGGITPENVAEICSKFSPELIDVSSGVEDAPGIKNAEKMMQLFEAINSL
ncbi:MULTISPECIES: bifunctional indole-3-glycerol phosphate synthase/phosphoribosylanthranilate isomerase [unclassified Fibrobacter]|uniref:bifunctional indole-3-glycerol phosphate synthase/phosphoribosylanthranilate isomerase n=1 Tax=unclassified Fibrobacter TaxID=2634177 RepID=UPI000D6AF3C2|nr:MULTISPECIES: bifunctional indole-3-glycerol phosphate synthase/phosphoribosylanthranilate isomerase [unclassified Fibrobacter]PWJ71955.1 indole-3-glycerol phosphate synthase [Fibrobacter sp. UWR4]PZW70405.1 indole-3-glycerol phosphate synthase [Fibrobacter sp. UWR1]